MSGGDGGKDEELRLQSQEDQELSTGFGPNQLILKMTSDHQTLDPTKCSKGHWLCTDLRLDMCTCVYSTLTIKITRQNLLSDLEPEFL